MNLKKKIEEANKLYREGNPIMSDIEYDSLVGQLSSLDNSFIPPKYNPTSRKVNLPFYMGSLDNIMDDSELVMWLSSFGSNTVFIITPKFDGVSLVTSDGDNRFAATRGDGLIGQDSLPHYDKMIKLPFNGISFGEAIMLSETFDKKYSESFSNARNLVSGMLVSNEASDILKDVHYIRYGLVSNYDRNRELDILNKSNKLEVNYTLLKLSDIIGVDHNPTVNGDWMGFKGVLANLLDNLYKEWGKHLRIDGLVIEVNSKEISSKLGRSSSGNPKYAKAYKSTRWQSIVKTGPITINIEVSKDGKLKPVANFEKVKLGDVMSSNATLYNMRYVLDNNLHDGAMIGIVRSGDVIPKHVSTFKFVPGKSQKYISELCCPSCGLPVKWDEERVELVCEGEHCYQKVINTSVHFFKKMGIEGFDKPTIETLYREGYTSIRDILDIGISELMSIGGFAGASSKKLVNQFDKLKGTKIPISTVLYSLNLFKGRIGHKIASKITKKVGNMGNIMYHQKMARVILVPGVKEKSADAYIRGLNKFNKGNDPNCEYVKKNFNIYYDADITKKTSESRLSGMSFVFTKIRDKGLENIILENGGSIKDSVTNSTTYLIVKELGLTSNKIKDAESKGVEILDIEKFRIVLNSLITDRDGR